MTPTRASGSNLRELTRRTVRAQIAERAMALFIAQGFEETTVEQIASEVGMSARSVFRYFDTKEDMVVGSMQESGALLADALERRPADEDPWRALRGALDLLLEYFAQDREAALARARMFASTPSLRAAREQKQARWRELLVPGVLARLSGGTAADRELRAAAITTAVLGCLGVAVARWSDQGGEADLGAMLDAAIRAVRE
ncbi:TetR/AcrR family transcriptional regulator [Actinacidiphila epipremni]|jgi:AcrR family transcriptional regulator|uniref:TetR family transcriptional regulator n=1 Tax=Actinacidiphila epipremni TaxID=2053013 RepID=A0ABX0ZEG6_9ACTN|nr:TetR/AcrR family transcriptional regulator [Actinacidiphila epipremni]NJP42169.1 TetR family transcriptional regulator [Actinacidiphila epipremni]